MELVSKILFVEDLEEQVFQLLDQKHYSVVGNQAGVAGVAETGAVELMSFCCGFCY